MTFKKLVIAIFFIVVYVNLFGQNRSVKYTTADGIPQDFVYTIAFDSDNFVWIGSGNGVSKFDAIDFTNYNSSHGLDESIVTTINWQEDTLVIGHFNGSISYGEIDDIKTISFVDSNFGRINTIEKYGKSFLFSAQNKGLYWANTLGDIKRLPFFIKHKVNDLLHLSADSFLVACEKGLFLQIDTMRPIAIKNGLNFKSLSRSTNEIAVLSSDGIFMYDSFGNSLRSISQHFSIDLQKKTKKIRIYKHKLYGFVEGVGVWRLGFDKYNLNDQFYDLNYFKNTSINDFNIDLEGNLWLATNGEGVDVFYNDWLNNILAFEKTVFVSLTINDNVAYFAKNKSIYKVLEHNSKFKLKFIDSAQGNINDVFVDKKNRIWCGTENGLEILNFKNNIDLSKLQTELKTKYITDINLYNGFIWLSTIGHGIYKISTNDYSFSNLTTRTGLLHNDIFFTYGDSKGRLWIATHETKISCLDSNGATIIIDLPDHEHSINITNYSESKSGEIWISSSGSGLWRYSNGNLTSFSNIVSEYSYSLLTHGKNLWVGFNDELARIDVEAMKVNPLKENFRVKELDFFTNSFLLYKNQILVAESQGLYALNVDHELYSKKKLPIYTRSILIDGEKVKTTNKLSLPPGRHTVEIEVNSICYNDRSLVKYEFNIRGDIDLFTKTGTGNKVVYPSLSSGKYDVYVRASSGEKNFGNWTPIINVNIEKPFYLKWWFVILAILFVSLTPFVFFRIRLKNLNARNLVLDNLISIRTKEVVLQKDEIKNQHDKIVLQQNEILDSIEYAKRIQTAMLLPKKEVLDLSNDFFVFFKPKDIVSGDFFWSAVVENKLIFSVADCTGHGVPGAFMSMLGISLLNQIVYENKIVKPSKILDALRESIINAMQQTNDSDTQHDGMDISIISYDLKSEVLEFSGANNSLYLVRDDSITQIKADSMPVSIYPVMNPFTNYLVDARKGDCIYMFSDGFPDQFGGLKGKKFKLKPFKDFLLEIYKQPMNEQNELLEKRLIEWRFPNGDKGEKYDQIDDVIVLGLKI